MNNGPGPSFLYLLAIVPPEPVLSEVWALKQEVHALTGSRNAVRLLPHITLWPPVRKAPAFAQDVHRILRAFAAQEIPFLVALRNFAWFGDRTLFIEVNTVKILQEFNSRLTHWCQAHGLEIPRDKRAFTPHMTLATRDLPASQIKALKQLFAVRVYAASFLVSHLTLFRHNGATWESVATFPLTS